MILSTMRANSRHGVNALVTSWIVVRKDCAANAAALAVVLLVLFMAMILRSVR